MVCTHAEAIILPHARSIAGFSTVVMPDNHVGTISSLPSDGTSSRSGLNVLSNEWGARPEQWVKPTDVGQNLLAKSHVRPDNCTDGDK